MYTTNTYCVCVYVYIHYASICSIVFYFCFCFHSIWIVRLHTQRHTFTEQYSSSHQENANKRVRAHARASAHTTLLKFRKTKRASLLFGCSNCWNGCLLCSQNSAILSFYFYVFILILSLFSLLFYPLGLLFGSPKNDAYCVVLLLLCQEWENDGWCPRFPFSIYVRCTYYICMFHHIHTNLFQLNVNKEKNAIPFSHAIRAMNFHRKLDAQMPHQTMTTVYSLFSFYVHFVQRSPLLLRHSSALFLSFFPHFFLLHFVFHHSRSIWVCFFALMMVLIYIVYFQHYNFISRDTSCVQWNDSLAFLLSLFYYIIIFCASFSLIFLSFHSLSCSRSFSYFKSHSGSPIATYTHPASFSLTLFSHSCHPISVREPALTLTCSFIIRLAIPFPLCVCVCSACVFRPLRLFALVCDSMYLYLPSIFFFWCDFVRVLMLLAHLVAYCQRHPLCKNVRCACAMCAEWVWVSEWLSVYFFFFFGWKFIVDLIFQSGRSFHNLLY